MARQIKVLTLHQPWASLCVIGAKRFETRSWQTNHRGLLAIHASLNMTFLYLAMDNSTFRSPLADAEIVPEQLPVGAILGWVYVAAMLKTEEINRSISPMEAHFGNYEPGRFAWSLASPWRLPSPIPTSGKQRIWKWDAPAGWNADAIAYPLK